MTLMFPKSPRLEDKKYLVAVRSMPCVVSGYTWFDGAPLGVEAAHIRHGLGGGMGMKPSDNLVLPLRHDLHEQQHKIGEEGFWLMHAQDNPDLLMRALKALARETYALWRTR